MNSSRLSGDQEDTSVLNPTTRMFQSTTSLLHTGYELDEVDTRILDFLDDIKTGAYREDLRNKMGSFLASSNQKYFQKDDCGVFVEVSV